MGILNAVLCVNTDFVVEVSTRKVNRHGTRIRPFMIRRIHRATERFQIGQLVEGNLHLANALHRTPICGRQAIFLECFLIAMVRNLAYVQVCSDMFHCMRNIMERSCFIGRPYTLS